MPVPSPKRSDIGRLPAYSGATVPAFDRLPARKRDKRQIQRCRLGFLVLGKLGARER